MRYPAFRLLCSVCSLCSLCFGALGCSNVDTGDNFIPPELYLDEGFFFCQIQPNVLTRHACADSDCHGGAVQPAIDPRADLEAMPTCVDTDGDAWADSPTSTIPQTYRDNLENLRFTVQSDPLSSDLYRRPTQLDPHPPELFGEADEEGRLLFHWIAEARN